MKTILIALMMFLPQLAQAGGSLAIIAVDYNPDAPSVRMQVRADYVAVPVHVQSEAKDPLKRADEIEKALRALADGIRQSADVKIKTGMVSLAPRERAKFSGFSSYEAPSESSAQLYIMAALKQETTVFAATKRIYQIVNAVHFADGTKVTLGNTALGMDDPEKYRPQLLGLISKSASETRKLMNATGPLQVEGIENPVSVMELNESDVILFIDYRMTVQMKAQ
jgi:hypothetical protein